MKKYDIAVLGWWYGINYGSILTYYGLNKYLEKNGYKVIMVNETLGYNGWRVQWPENIISMEFAHRSGYHISKQYNRNELSELNELTDNFIVGSDQLWNPGIPRVNEDLLLSFVDDGNQRISYGTSISRGEEYFNHQWIIDFRANLSKFSGISVRESSAVDTIKKYTGLKAIQVIDPVYLLDKEDYILLANDATLQFTGKFMALFLLDPSEEKKNIALKIFHKLGFEKIIVIPNPEAEIQIYKDLFNEKIFQVLEDAMPENMLAIYSKSDYIVTDSFHGTVFASIFEKPFNSFYNLVRGATRFEELMNLLGFGDSRRIFEDMSTDEIINSKNISRDINYYNAKIRIQDKKRHSEKWLKDTIDGNTTIAFEKRFTNFLTNNSFTFYRANDIFNPISVNVTFDKYGVISGILSPNERYWRYDKGKLEIYNSSNILTSVFKVVDNEIEFSDLDFKVTGVFSINESVEHVIETTQSYCENVFIPRLNEVLLKNKFSFYRENDGFVISDNVTFNADMSIDGVESTNESYFSFDTYNLEILNLEKKPTTIFRVLDSLSEIDKENFEISGFFVDNPDIKHVLKKIIKGYK